jgi:serine/threonine protein kinase
MSNAPKACDASDDSVNNQSNANFEPPTSQAPQIGLPSALARLQNEKSGQFLVPARQPHPPVGGSPSIWERANHFILLADAVSASSHAVTTRELAELATCVEQCAQRLLSIKNRMTHSPRSLANKEVTATTSPSLSLPLRLDDIQHVVSLAQEILSHELLRRGTSPQPHTPQQESSLALRSTDDNQQEEQQQQQIPGQEGRDEVLQFLRKKHAAAAAYSTARSPTNTVAHNAAEINSLRHDLFEQLEVVVPTTVVTSHPPDGPRPATNTRTVHVPPTAATLSPAASPSARTLSSTPHDALSQNKNASSAIIEFALFSGLMASGDLSGRGDRFPQQPGRDMPHLLSSGNDLIAAPTSSVFGGEMSTLGVSHHITNTLVKATDDLTGNKTINQYLVLDDIGEGACGKVKLAYSLERHITVAIKIVRRAPNIGEPRTANLGRRTGVNEETLRREIDLMKRLRHPNLVSLFEVIDDPTAKKLYLVMRFADKGSVGAMREDLTCGAMPLRALVDMAFQVCCGLQYLHERGIYHRDIKPENILQTSDGQYMIGDFGISVARRQRKKRSVPQAAPTRSPGLDTLFDRPDLEEHDEEASMLGIGTPLFMAPELTVFVARTTPLPDENDNSHVTSLMDDGAKQEEEEKLANADMWALGVTIMSLATGRCPIQDPAALIENPEKEANSARACFIETMKMSAAYCCSKECQNSRDVWGHLVAALLSIDATKRPTAAMLRKVSKTLSNKSLCRECASSCCSSASKKVSDRGGASISPGSNDHSGPPQRASLVSGTGSAGGGGSLPAAELKRRRETLRAAFETWEPDASSTSTYRQIRVFRSDDPHENELMTGDFVDDESALTAIAEQASGRVEGSSSCTAPPRAGAASVNSMLELSGSARIPLGLQFSTTIIGGGGNPIGNVTSLRVPPPLRIFSFAAQ